MEADEEIEGTSSFVIYPPARSDRMEIFKLRLKNKLARNKSNFNLDREERILMKRKTRKVIEPENGS